MIYIASPYSHPDPAVREQRYLEVMRYFAWLINNPRPGNNFSFSPIVHCHEVANRHTLPTDAASWKRYNFAYMANCKELHVLQLDDWALSIGVAEEVEFAEILDIPVLYACWVKSIKDYTLTKR